MLRPYPATSSSSSVDLQTEGDERRGNTEGEKEMDKRDGRESGVRKEKVFVSTSIDCHVPTGRRGASTDCPRTH